MADSDKQILITPNISQTAQPEIKFVGKDNSPLYIKVLDDNSLSFEGTEGQVFSISPTMSSGDIFSVNDISGIQSIAVNADGNITMDAQSQSVTIKNSGSNTSNLILENTNADAVDGPILELFRNSASPANGDDMGQILWSGEKSDSSKYSVTKMYAEINTVDNSDRLLINVASSGGSGLNDYEYMRFDGGVRDVIINEFGQDIDVRIEGDSDSALFFTDASSDRIGIGTTSPGTQGECRLEIVQDNANNGFGLVVGADVSATSISDSTRKFTRIGMHHHDTDEEFVNLIVGDSDGTDNKVSLGGGTNQGNAATLLNFYAAANATTVTGTVQANITSSGLQIGSGARVTTILDQDDMSSNSATALATQQSIKAYVDSQSSGGGASTLNGLTDVLISNDSFIINNMGSAPTTGTLSSAQNNIAIGDAAMDALTEGDNNVAFGDNALGALTTGANNIAIGPDSLQAAVSASGNVGIGQGAMTYVTGDGNVAIGISALAGASSGTISATNNVAIGENTMPFITTGIQNVAIGDDAGIGVTTGNYNVLIGPDAGDSLQTGHENILIGRDAGQNITSGSDNVIIGGVDADSATGSDQLKIASGDGGVTWLKGSSAGAITFNSAYTFPASDGSNGQVLQTNGSGTLSFASVSGGSGISDLVDDTSPQLGGDLDTNSFNIKFDDAHGIRDDSDNEMLVFEKTANADSYIEVHNAVANNTTSNTLFGSDVVGTNTGNATTSVGPGFAATGPNANVALAFKTKGLGKFVFVNDDTGTSSGPTLNLMRKHSSEADNDNIGQILFQGMDSSPTGSDLEDLRDYAKIRVSMIDVTDGTADGRMRLSALVANSHKTLLEVGVHEDDDNAAGVSLWRGQMRDIGSNTTLDEGDYAGRYLRVTSAVTVTLPASPAKGEQYVIISDHSGTTTISANGSDTMNGSTNNQTITTRYEAKTCIAVSTSAWIVLG